MTIDEKLAAILAAVQTDPGNRGLADLFAYCPGDFAAACRLLAAKPAAFLNVITGFLIPTADPPAAETDGPLGAVFLIRGLYPLGVSVTAAAERHPTAAMAAGLSAYGFDDEQIIHEIDDLGEEMDWISLDRLDFDADSKEHSGPTVQMALERPGPAADGTIYTMRGRDITRGLLPASESFSPRHRLGPTIGIGDGGNEIGMGKIPHETIVKNIPNGDLIHCRVPTDHLIVAGVSNWGAYALAAGVYVLRGVEPPRDLFDPDREREILEVMVREGPLVDGVTGKQTATVDGLTWDEYVKPMIRIREILES